MQTLKVKCPTWEHVETFYSRKLRRDGTLTLRLPFQAEKGMEVALCLQLPDGESLEIPGRILDSQATGDGGKHAVRIHLHGATREVMEPLAAKVALSKQARQQAESKIAPLPPQVPEQVVTVEPLPGRVPPTSVPIDAPLDELVDPVEEPTIDDVSEYEREVFLELQAELGRLRELSTHEVLGVAHDTNVEVLRQAYFGLTKRFHPDIYARYRSPAIMHIVQELFIHINSAYDRMRDALVAAGRAMVAGPALFPHSGWLANLDDIDGARDDDVSSIGSSHSGMTNTASFPQPGKASGNADAVASPHAQLESEVLALLSSQRFEDARERVAGALHFEPRERRLRSLYHVISGRELMANGEFVAAVTQFEAALAHDREFEPAREALAELQKRGQHGGFLPRTMR